MRLPAIIYLIALCLILSAKSGLSQNYFDTSIVVKEFEVLFESGRADINDYDSTDFKEILDLASHYDSTQIIIRAYTDADGSETSNLELSRARAETVRDTFVRMGYDSSYCQLHFFGENEPKGDNQTEEGKAINRRVEVILYRQQRMTWLYGQILDDSTQQPIVAQLLLYARDFIDSTWSDSLGQYRLVAPIKEDVVVEFRSDFYMPQFLSVEIKPIVTNEPFPIHGTKAKVGRNFKLLNLIFFGNQSRPLPGSRKTLNVVGRFLNNHQGVCVEIQGHINKPGSEKVSQYSWDYFLSVARAKVVYDYLSDFSHIPSDRMYFRGHGNWKMLFPYAKSKRQQQLNRRVEIHICKCNDSMNQPNSEMSKRFQFYELKGRDNVFN